ncbi:choice-of-anchor O protein [Desulforhopalus sp. IMCC35007]|uniref:choice-of-anchor O protein n=1 Tax=Desulforhopalus sp. IMCC35007 TaxID=2569543 RepID=UPI0010AE5C3C|nr:choice-of-anchor O protein [Desulforhopalus sp. IMCC35007]TKB08188.1 hypothetical protein FCL48_14520 [Desulforhopalus sp. IMCC35007]
MAKLRLLAIGFITLLLCSGSALASEGYGPGRIGLKIFAGRDHADVGDGGIWNSRDKLHIQLDPADGWRITAYHIDLGGGEDYTPPLTPTGNPKIGHFAYKDTFSTPYTNEVNLDDHIFRRTLVLNLEEDLGFHWGTPWADLRTQGVAIFLSLVKIDDQGKVLAETGAWAVPELIVWSDEPEAEAIEDLITDEVVADTDGEVISDEVLTIKWVGKGNKVAKVQHQKAKKSWVVEETEEVVSFDGGRWGYWFRYEMAHPERGHFIDSPVAGLSVQTPTYEGITGEDAAFDYFPGESVDISIGSMYLGSALADHKISPLDIFPISDTEDSDVLNMARLLQSLDADGDPKGGINITPEVVAAFEQTMNDQNLTEIDFTNEEQVQGIIIQTAINAEPVQLTLQSVEDAKAHLEDTLNNSMFRKNISKTPELASAKAKMNTATVWLPAMKADGTPATIEYTDEDGNVLPYPDVNYPNGKPYDGTQAQPLIVTYTDADPITGEHDVYAAVSRDDGATWKRKNLSRTADRSSFTTADGQPYYGGCKKPVFQVKGNKILVAWSSKYARGGKPGYVESEFLTEQLYDADSNAINEEAEDEYGVNIVDENGLPLYTNPSFVGNDIWGVAGPQRSHDYTEDGYTDADETPFSALDVPHSALWVCRGIIATQTDVNAGVGDFVGDIVWFKPERLTSGRRDVNQIFVGAAGSAGFAMVWQEDPNGVKPGKAIGPGPGWGGATTSHKTDIWYSYLAWGDHTKVDTNFVPGSDVEHNADVDTDEEWVSNRPKALVPMSLPVRMTDNDVVNTDNIMVALDETTGFPTTDNPDNPLGYAPEMNDDAQSDVADGTHAYAYMIPGLIDVDNASGAPNDTENPINQNGFYQFENYQDATKYVAITEDGRLLDGDTGASRGNVFLQPYAYTKADNSIGISAWAIITYEETKGAGAGPPEDVGTGEQPEDGSGEGNDAYLPEEGKNVIYHSFDFKTPDLVSAGRIVNRPEFDDVDEDNYIDSGELVYLVDEEGGQILDYLGRPQLAYENARRGRFIPQGIGAFGASGTAQLMVHKQGPEGSGRPSDILLRRWVIPAGAKKVSFKNTSGATVGLSIKASDDKFINPYSVYCLLGDWVVDEESGQGYYADGVQNMSSVTPRVTTASQGEPEQDDPWGAVKVVEWDQTEANLNDPTGNKEDYDGTWEKGNPFDDARAHRGAIRGDFVTMGFSYTANWAAARNGNDNYNFYIRRSFDGGQTWITDPDGNGVEHCRTWTYPSGTESAGAKIEECTPYAAGEFEAMRNLSQLPNHKESVIEPRIVAVPGTIKSGGKWTGIPEDQQDANVFYVAYGTSTNPKKDPETGEQEEPVPQDLFWSVSVDRGESYYEETWVKHGGELTANTDPENIKTGWPWMAKGDQEQGEVQLRMTPDGSRFYASWLDEGEEGSDIVFRRIMPSVFLEDAAVTVDSTDSTLVTVEAGSDADSDTGDSGGGDED